MKAVFSHSLSVALLVFFLAAVCVAQDPAPTPAPTPVSQANREQAEAVIKKAVQHLGGEKYLNVKTQIGRGKYTTMQDGAAASFQNFVDVIVYPDKERTEFKGAGSKTIQTNTGNTGWAFDGSQELVKVQDQDQVDSWQRGVRTSLDYLLRGFWRNEAEISYLGKRPATLGKRNEVVKLTYNGGLTVEFEFAADDGLPQKSIFKHLNASNEEVKEEDRYAQFIDVAGIKTPYIIDRFTNGVQSSRINYESIEFNRAVPDSIFTKPASKKDVKEMKWGAMIDPSPARPTTIGKPRPDRPQVAQTTHIF